jgi:hypothetical protein
MLKQGIEAPGRVYLLLRVVDEQRRGWLGIEEVGNRLTDRQSPLRICGRRRLRQLLQQGEGIFWQRDRRGRLWLAGAHRVAHRLGIARLQGFPIALPVAALLGGIQTVRAHFYAAFHSGRDEKPISRECLRGISGTAERTQRVYDRVAKVRRQSNLAVGERHSQQNAQERAWRQGRGVFRFLDGRGLQGRKNEAYVAWRLPNSYGGPHERRSPGSRKRVNRKLADLVYEGIPGNSEGVIERVFWADGGTAARQYNRDPRNDAYWSQRDGQRKGECIWWVFAGMR